MKNILAFILLFIYSNTYSQQNDNRIHFEVDQLASYHGGYEKFNQFISDNINCKIKINRKEKNQIQLRFVVEKTGEIKIVELLSDKPFVCKDEIIKAIRSCTAWKPALKGNLPVRSIVQMDVNFDK